MFGLILGVVSCGESQTDSTQSISEAVTNVLTADEQAALTP